MNERNQGASPPPPSDSSSSVLTKLCYGGCGFIGSPHYEGLCSQCYNSTRASSISVSTGNSITSFSQTDNKLYKNDDLFTSSLTKNESIPQHLDHDILIDKLNFTNKSIITICEDVIEPNKSSFSITNYGSGEITTNDKKNLNTPIPQNHFDANTIPISIIPVKLHLDTTSFSKNDNVCLCTEAQEFECNSKRIKLSENMINNNSEKNISLNDTSFDRKHKRRCSSCKKNVGLFGFSCRCGGIFCSFHRYSNTHECTFNYREAGREDIHLKNPKIIGEKLTRI